MVERREIRVALGGVGGDAHSVGLTILRRALDRAGYRLHFLGTQASLDDLCEAARDADAVLVSNIDGHARTYLRDLPAARARAGGDDAVWYLGGNPSVTRGPHVIDELLSFGFARVIATYVDPSAVVAMLDDDLGAIPNAVQSERLPFRAPAPVANPPEPVPNERTRVLAQWSTGDAAKDIIDNARVLGARTNLAKRQAKATAAEELLIHPRCGVGDVSHQHEVFCVLREAGADVLSFQIDSLTRNNAYEALAAVFAEGAHAALNGYPAVNHGVDAMRALTSAHPDTPFQVRHSTRDPRLLAEMSFAGGATAYEGGALTYNLPYYRDYSPELACARWEYVDRLAGRYTAEHGVVIDREFFGVLTATLVPPSLAITACVLEALMAARAGVKSVSLGYAEQGHRAQDVAAIRALRKVGRKYLERFGFDDVAVFTVFHQYMGAFPPDVDKSRALLRGSAMTARLSGATRLMLKTVVEAVRIPTCHENAASLRFVRDAAAQATPEMLDVRAMEAEEALIIEESCAILDRSLDAGRDDFQRAAIEAVLRGYLDVPFSPSLWNRGLVMTARDRTGAVRFADAGNVPLPKGPAEHHRSLMSERVSAERLHIEELVERDVVRLARGELTRWPFDA